MEQHSDVSSGSEIVRRTVRIWMFALLLCTANAVPGEPDDVDHEWATQHLVEYVVDRFHFLVESGGHTYAELETPKAGAACVTWTHQFQRSPEPDVPLWGGAWKYETIEKATQAALAQCEKAKEDRDNMAGDCVCELVYRGDDVVLEPPSKIVERVAAWVRKQTIPTLCSDWFQMDQWRSVVDPFGANDESFESSCPGYTWESIDHIEFAIDDVLSRAKEADGPEIFPAPPTARKTEIDGRRLTRPSDGAPQSHYIGFYPPTGDDYIGTWSTPIALPNGWVYKFKTHRVPADKISLVLKKLASLERTTLYGRISKTQRADVKLPFFNPSDSLARYSRVYDLTDYEVHEAFYDLEPENAYDGRVNGERAQRIWVESAIPVDADWIPVGQPLRRVMPIAVQTDRALYLYSIEVIPRRGGGGTIDHFEGKVFDLSGCAKLTECLQAVIGVFREEMAAEFLRNPLAAPVARNRLSPPTQLRFQRKFEPSAVLQGMAGPYFELATYTATIWPGPADSFLGTAELYWKWQGDKSGDRRQKVADQIFLQVEQALQIAVGRKGAYVEPTPDQYAAYQRAVTKAIGAAVDRTTMRLGGKLGPDGVGMIRTKDFDQ